MKSFLTQIHSLIETCHQNKKQLFCKSLQKFNILWKLISFGVDGVFLWTKSKAQSFPWDSPL